MATPGAAERIAADLQHDLEQVLAGQFADLGPQVQLVVDELVDPPADADDLVTAGRTVLLARDVDLLLCITDLPLHASRRPLIAHASPIQGVAVISTPALGAVAVRKQARQVAMRLLHVLLGDVDADADRLGRRGAWRARQLTQDVEDADGLRFAARVLTGHLRLLLGMVAANRPWQLAARLSRALVAAIAAGVFALVTSDVWRLADAFGPWRHLLVAAGSVAGIAVTLIVGAGLWERAPNRRARQQVLLFNAATTLTVLIGATTLYVALFVVAFLGAALLVVPTLLQAALGHDVGILDYAQVAWLTSSLATAGGALGAGLETDEVVRDAAYRRHAHVAARDDRAGTSTAG